MTRRKIRHYFDRQGRLITLAQWVAQRSDTAARTVASTNADGIWITTEFGGTDYRERPPAPTPSEPPLVYRTVIFGGDRDGHAELYATEAEARAGHAHWVAMVASDLQAGGQV